MHGVLNWDGRPDHEYVEIQCENTSGEEVRLTIAVADVAAQVRRAQDFNITLDDVSITHLSFGKEYTAAVEAKQVAQQEAERARFVVDKAKQERRSTVIKAQGEAKSAQLIGDAVRDNPGFLQLRRLEAARDIAGTLSKSTNRLFLDGNSLLLNLSLIHI